MDRIFGLAPIVLLTGCVIAAVPPPPPPQVPALGEVRLGYDEMDNVPFEVEEVIYREIDGEAFSRGISFDSVPTTIDIQGYLSVVTSGEGTLVIYVFDLIDRTGRRILRVGGQLTSLESPPDPWGAVDRHIADQMVDRLFEAFDQWLAENAVGT